MVHAIAWYQAYRSLIGLNCIGGGQLDYIETTVIPKYEHYCKVCCRFLHCFLTYQVLQRVAKTYGKDFRYPKHHQIAHVADTIRNLGALVNQTTRPGEGFIIEVKEQYQRTNGRNAADQASLASVLQYASHR